MSNLFFETKVRGQKHPREADKCRNSKPYINHFILSKYCRHLVLGNQCPERVGHRRSSLPTPVMHLFTPSVRHLNINHIQLHNSCHSPNHFVVKSMSACIVSKVKLQLSYLGIHCKHTSLYNVIALQLKHSSFSPTKPFFPLLCPLSLFLHIVPRQNVQNWTTSTSIYTERKMADPHFMAMQQTFHFA